MGGPEEDEANIIAYNLLGGVLVGGGEGHAVRYNEYLDNDGIDINLGSDQLTVNDALDLDVGPNGLQNSPELESVEYAFGNMVVSGVLHSTPGNVFEIDLYRLDEGRSTHLRSIEVRTDEQGDTMFSESIPIDFFEDWMLRAVATSASGDTSEFSPTVGLSDAFVSIRTVENTNDSGPGSLRQAITDANAAPGKDMIAFNIPGDGPHTIAPLSGLPEILDPVVIDATTQPGYVDRPIVGIDGIQATMGTYVGEGTHGFVRGLQIRGGDSTIRGLAINNFRAEGVRIVAAGGNRVEACHIGTDFEGAVAMPNGTYHVFDEYCCAGVWIENTSSNRIGGDGHSTRNVISGNSGVGIGLRGNESRDNWILGNFVGIDSSGSRRLPNELDGININASFNHVGDGTESGRNVVSGNLNNGLMLTDTASLNRVLGNYFGTDSDGDVAIGNGYAGILLYNGANSNTIGGRSASAANLSSGNSEGIIITGANTQGNLIEGNWIGLASDGYTGLGNEYSGIGVFEGAAANIVGGSESGAGNILVSNGQTGVNLNSAGRGNAFWGNYIGVTMRGHLMPNRFTALQTGESSGSIIGGILPGQGNVMAGHWENVNVFHLGRDNSIRGNTIFSGLQGIDIDFLWDPDGYERQTPNDPGDLDEGGNRGQNFPILSAISPGANTAVSGRLDSAPSTEFQIDFYENPSSLARGVNEGRDYLGTVAVTTDAAGIADLDLLSPFHGQFGKLCHLHRDRSGRQHVRVFAAGVCVFGCGSSSRDASEVRRPRARRSHRAECGGGRRRTILLSMAQVRTCIGRRNRSVACHRVGGGVAWG